MVYVNLSHAVHPTNVYSFQLSDCIEIDNIRIRVLDFVKQYLKIYLEFEDKYIEELLPKIDIVRMECNSTIQCIGKCKPKDVVNLFEKAFPKVTVYKETTDLKQIHKKPKTGMTARNPHEWILKVYGKSFEQKKVGNFDVEPNLVRVELVFLDYARC